MTTTRLLVLAFVAAATLAASGCGNKCNDATPPVGTLNTSAACTAPAGAPVTVAFHVCPKCDQGTPTCIVHDNSAQGQVTLEPVSEVCDPSSSCPLIDAQSCTIPTLNCQFTAPANGPVNVTIVTPTGAETFQLAIAGSGTTPVTCSL